LCAHRLLKIRGNIAREPSTDESEVKFVSNDYTNPNTYPKALRGRQGIFK